MILEGSKVNLRRVTPTDFRYIVSWGLESSVNRFVTGEYPRSMEDCRRWHAAIQTDRRAKAFVITRKTDSSKPIGDVELSQICWRRGEGELRIRIGEPALWGQGFGSDAVAVLLDYAFGQLRLRSVYLRVLAGNTRAIRCYEKCGFRKVGRLSRELPGGGKQDILLMRAEAADELHGRTLASA